MNVSGYSTPAEPVESGLRKPTKVHAQITSSSDSALRRYQRVVVGSTSLLETIRYELIHGIGAPLPGALGVLIRKVLYPRMLKRVGRGTLFGPGVTIRHPGKIEMGTNVVVADGCTIDARGDSNRGIRLGDNVILGQRSMLLCKGGNIVLGNNVGIGYYTSLCAVYGNVLEIEDNAMLGPYVYVDGTSYHYERTDIPMSAQGLNPRGGIRIGAGTWVGAHAAILDGVKIGRDAIVAAGAVVTKDVPDFAIVAGVPARVVKYRKTPSPDDLARNADCVGAPVASADAPGGLHQPCPAAVTSV